MPETLLNASSVLLFGRLVDDLRIEASASESGHDGPSGHLEQQFRAKDPNFARIYGFGQDGIYHLLPTPALFLVHGPGTPAADALSGLKARGGDGGPADGQAQPVGPLLPDDMMVWSYDRADYSIRLDIRTGTLDQLLHAAPGTRGMSVQGMSIQGMSIRGMSLRGGDKD